MKIKSAFKDYYDYVAHMYDWDDSNSLYIRDRFGKVDNPYKSETFNVPVNSFLEGREKHDRVYMGLGDFHRCGYRYIDVSENLISYAYLIIVDKRYVVKPKRNVRGLYLEDFDNYEIVKEREVVTDESYLNLSRQLETPVYLVKMLRDSSRYFQKSNLSVDIFEHIPNLGSIGLASVYPAEQIFQDIKYFKDNTIRQNPDIAPPVEVDNKIKIMQHGFDIKQSFRHRV